MTEQALSLGFAPSASRQYVALFHGVDFWREPGAARAGPLASSAAAALIRMLPASGWNQLSWISLALSSSLFLMHVFSLSDWL